MPAHSFPPLPHPCCLLPVYTCVQKHAFKRHEVPAHVHESRPLEGFARTVTAPAAPADVFQPFNLLSEAKHARYQELRAARLAKEEARKEEARMFKATTLDKVGGWEMGCEL